MTTIINRGDADYPPPDIIEAVNKVSAYFKGRGEAGWQAGGCADRFTQVRDFTEQERSYIIYALRVRAFSARMKAGAAAQDVHHVRYRAGAAAGYLKAAQEIEALVHKLDAKNCPVVKP